MLDGARETEHKIDRREDGRMGRVSAGTHTPDVGCGIRGMSLRTVWRNRTVDLGSVFANKGLSITRYFRAQKLFDGLGTGIPRK